MKEKKLQVFVSSTFTDLMDERQAAVEAILSSGHIPAGMELFSAGDESQMTVINRWIDESDIYLLILGGRYGSIEPKSGKSYTQLEFEYAKSENKPLFSVVISEKAIGEKINKLGRDAIEETNPDKLSEFRKEVMLNLVKFWDDKKDIKIAIHETISDFSYRKELIGWIRSDNLINAGLLAEEIARLTNENSTLRNKLSANDNNTSALYSGLDFTQLSELLSDEHTEFDTNKNLFELILKEGNFLLGDYSPSDENITKSFDRLIQYKLVEKSNPWAYTFTSDGHKFYLRALLYEKNKK